MSETVAIILSCRKDTTQHFEQLFSEEVYPLWKEYHAQGRMLAASLTPALDAPEMNEQVQEYILLVEIPSRAEHDQFDTDKRFLNFLDKVKASQPVEPKVWLGNTLFKI